MLELFAPDRCLRPSFGLRPSGPKRSNLKLDFGITADRRVATRFLLPDYPTTLSFGCDWRGTHEPPERHGSALDHVTGSHHVMIKGDNLGTDP